MPYKDMKIHRTSRRTLDDTCSGPCSSRLMEPVIEGLGLSGPTPRFRIGSVLDRCSLTVIHSETPCMQEQYDCAGTTAKTALYDRAATESIALV